MSDKRQTASISDRLFAMLQRLLPHHLLSRGMHRLARLEADWFRKPFTHWFIRHFAVDLSEAEETDPDRYPSFNAFFTRALQPGARSIAADPEALACPVDGAISQIGNLHDGQLVQAKGHYFTAAGLLGDRAELAREFSDGLFATIYLAPFNYHRIHMPCDARLTEMIYVPGRLFSVNAATARTVPNLFARNERVACLFETSFGPMAMVLVGALFVGSIETVWAGEITPPHRNAVSHRTFAANGPSLDKGAEMGRFNMGSTVILLLPKNGARWDPGLEPGRPVRLGMPLGRTAPGL